VRFLIFTNLFPSSNDPNWGIFVYQRMKHVTSLGGNSACVIAPVPYFPAWLSSPASTKWARLARWQKYGRLPREEKVGKFTVSRPRYLFLPIVGRPLQGFLMFLGAVFVAWRLHRKLPFDCIDAHFAYPDGHAAVMLGAILRLPVVVTVHGTDISVYSSLLFRRSVIRWTLDRAHAIVAVSNSLAQRVLELGVPASKIWIIPNGVDVERFRPVSRAFARSYLKIPMDATVIVSVGALIPRKGHEFLIRCFPEIIAKHSSARLYVIGEGDLRRKLQSASLSSGAGDRIFFPGAIRNEDLAAWYSAADMSCLVSSREGYPCVVLESLACGTPVVATRILGTQEIASTVSGCVLVKQTCESIATGVRLALEKAWEREVIALETLDRDWTVVAEKLVPLFSSVFQTGFSSVSQTGVPTSISMSGCKSGYSVKEQSSASE
jgi:teichuronic acid biosynthesis glycosyltransferase TuaC